jgi:hypothetical protein
MNNVLLQTVAAYAEILGAMTIVTGFVLGWFQIRFYRSQQRDRVAINLVQTFYNPEFSRAVTLVQGLPDHVSAQELRARGPEYIEAISVVTMSLETMGLLVYKKIASADIAIELAGGLATTMFRKSDVWLEVVRDEQKQPTWAEWFEWFAKKSADFKESRQPGHLRQR